MKHCAVWFIAIEGILTHAKQEVPIASQPRRFPVQHHGSSQSDQSRDLAMKCLLYMRIPTNKVAMIKQMAAQKTIQCSREDGSMKLGFMPGGGCMLGIFARAFASAMLPATRELAMAMAMRLRARVNNARHGLQENSPDLQHCKPCGGGGSTIYCHTVI